MKIKALLALLLLCFMLLPVLAQTKPAVPPQPQQTPENKDDDVVKISTNLVQVDVMVTKDGKPVPNLTADDFEIFEDGKKQTITSFAYISNVAQPPSTPVEKGTGAAPYTRLKPEDARRIVAFVVDDLGLSAESLYRVRRQLRKFVEEQLQPSDLIAIIRTGSEMGALQQFTNDKRLLTRAADQLRWSMCNRVGITVFRPFLAGSAYGTSEIPICGYRTYGMTLQSLRFILDAMAYLPGRKSLVLLSDSLPRESQDELFPERGVLRDTGIVRDDSLSLPQNSINYHLSLQKLAEKAIRSSVVIYSVDTQGLQYTGPTAADALGGNLQQMLNLMSMRSQLIINRREGGELIAKQTGGFQVRNSNSYGLDRIMEDQGGYYLLGYRPTDATFNRRFHQLKAKLKRGGMNVRTRFGFFGVTEEEANRARPTTRELTNLALASPFAAQDIEVDLTSFFADDKTLGSTIRSFVYIDAKNISFTEAEGRYQAELELNGAIYGDNGMVVEQVRRNANLSLPQEDYEQARRWGMGVSFDMPVTRAGSFQVRVVARDRSTSKIGSAGQFVVVPELKNKQLAVSGIVLGENGRDQTITNPGSRRFLVNTELYYAFFLYNAANAAGKLRNLSLNATLFRDGKNIYSGPETPIKASDRADVTRVFVNGVIKLSPELEPGSYYLQVTVTDKDGDKKSAPVVQWVDFFVEKQ